jgi:hypothetical protein
MKLFCGLACALLVLMVAAAQSPGAVVGWYNGEWRSGLPGQENWYVNASNFKRVYDQFEVPAGGWTIAGVFSDNGFADSRVIVYASWEIRRDMSPGNGGQIVESGLSAVTQSPDPSVTAPRYPAAELPRHFRIVVENLRVPLPAGHYWLSVTPVGADRFHASATLGANGIGLDRNGPGIALVDYSEGPHFAIAESAGHAGQEGIARHFAQGVLIAH